MTEAFKNRMKKKLIELEGEMIANVRSERDAYDELRTNPEPKDTAEVAQFRYTARQTADMGVADQRRLRRIRAALDLISSDRYGICRNCGREISEDRLEAIPYAQLCIDCKRGEEDREETAE